MTVLSMVGLGLGLLGTLVSALGHDQDLNDAVEKKFRKFEEEDNDNEEEEES